MHSVSFGRDAPSLFVVNHVLAHVAEQRGAHGREQVSGRLSAQHRAQLVQRVAQVGRQACAA